MCEDPQPDSDLTTNEAVNVCKRILEGKSVKQDVVLTVKAYCYVNDHFAKEVSDRLCLSEDSVQTILDRVAYL